MVPSGFVFADTASSVCAFFTRRGSRQSPRPDVARDVRRAQREERGTQRVPALEIKNEIYRKGGRQLSCDAAAVSSKLSPSVAQLVPSRGKDAAKDGVNGVELAIEIE